jgi:hypothetical protein
VGQYLLANFTIENDGAGHTLIVDPPIPNDAAGAGGQSVGGSTLAQSSTIIASAPKQTETGWTFGDNFVFSFAAAARNSPTDIHLDSLQFNYPNFVNALAALSATHDDSHSMITVDAHDLATLSDVLKVQAQLHADFHMI